jgi:dTDP-4-amino-4,6-dideoxygalactose transaminase
VHLYGQAAPVERLVPLARRIGAYVVEDAAQSQGARRDGVSAGALGDAAATSFYPGKNLGAYGDAGAALTGSADVAERMRMIRDHGSPRKYEHDVVGVNSRLDTLQAVVLSAKLRRLAGWNAARRAAAARYGELLAGCDDVVLPGTLDGNEHVWHLYVIRVPHRDRVLEELRAAGIGAGIHYPVPVHLTGAFADLGYAKGAFPVAERAARDLLSLPLFPEITPAQQERVISVLMSALLAVAAIADSRPARPRAPTGHTPAQLNPNISPRWGGRYVSHRDAHTSGIGTTHCLHNHPHGCCRPARPGRRTAGQRGGAVRPSSDQRDRVREHAAR